MLELEHGFRIVDVHARLDPDPEMAIRGYQISPDRLEREMHQAGVVRSIVAPGPLPRDQGYLRANNAVARLSVDRPFLAFARLNGPRDPSNRPTARLRNLAATQEKHHATSHDVEQYAYDDRFHGFVLAPTIDGLPGEEVLDELEDVGLPVFVHVGEYFPPQTMAETLLEWDFPTILASSTEYPMNWPLMEQAVDLLDDHNRLYLGTGAIRYRSPLERGLLEHPDRILFGSGAPAVHPDVGVMELLTLDVSEDAMHRAFSKNPSRVVPGLAPGE